MYVCVGGRIAHDAHVIGMLPRVHLTLPGIERNDSNTVPLVRYGYSYSDATLVLGHERSWFGSYGAWNKALQTLVLRFAGPTIEPQRNYSLEFYLENPTTYQDGPAIFIRTSGLASSSELVDKAPAGNIRNALSIGGFVETSIVAQTNPAQNGTNEIRIELVPQLNHPVSPRVELLASGHSYGPGDIRVFNNGSEVSNFNATFTTDAEGRITRILNRNFGDNFIFTDTSEVRAYLPSQDVTQDLRVRTIEIISPGSGHNDGTFDIIVQCNTPTCVGHGFSGTYTVEAGIVVLTTINDRGSGYALNPPVLRTQGCNLQPNFGYPCVVAELKAYVPKGASFRLFAPFVKVSGLTGAQSPPSGPIPLASFANNATRVYGSEAVWNLEEGSLTLSLLRTALNGTRYGVAVVLQNQDTGQEMRHPVITGQAGFRYARQFLARASGNSAPLLICNVTHAFISQDNSGQGQVNNYTVTFASTVTLFGSDPRSASSGLTGDFHNRITIAGLTGSAEPSSTKVPISSSSFLNGTWDQAAGLLVVPVNEQLAAGVQHSFSFLLTNPVQLREPANVTIASVFFLKTPMATGTGNNAPLRVIGFTVAKIAQSNPSAAAVNTLTVTIQSSETLLARLSGKQTLLVVQGLTGTDTRDSGALFLTDISGQVHATFGNSGVWRQGPGALILSVLQDAAPLQDLVFSVQVRNPATPQAGPTVSVLTSQGLIIERLTMLSGQGLSKAMLVAGFTYSFAAQSTPSQTAANTLTISFACNFPLKPSENPIISIDGLTGSATTGDQYLPLTAGNTSFFGDGTGSTFHTVFWRSNQLLEFRVEFPPFDGPGGLDEDGNGCVTEEEYNVLAVDGWPTFTAAAGFDVAGSGVHAQALQDCLSTADYSALTSAGADTHIAAGTVFSASVVVTNPSHGQDSPYLRIRSTGAGFSTAWQAVSKAPGNSAPLLVAMFSLLSMGQSSAVPADHNTITVSLATNCDVHSSSHADSVVFTRDAELTAARGRQSTAQAVLSAAQAGLLAAQTALDGVDPADSGGLASAQANVTAAQGAVFTAQDAAARADAEVTQAVAALSAAKADAEAARVQLVISGLNSTNLAPGAAVPLADRTNAFVAIMTRERAGVINETCLGSSCLHRDRVMVLDLTGATPLREDGLHALNASGTLSHASAGVIYVFQFNVTNPAATQEPPEISVSVRGNLTIGATLAHRPAGLDAALRVFTFATVTGNLTGDTTTWTRRTAMAAFGPRRGSQAVFVQGFAIGPAAAHSTFGHLGQWFQVCARASACALPLFLRLRQCVSGRLTRFVASVWSRGPMAPGGGQDGHSHTGRATDEDGHELRDLLRG